MCKGGVSWDQWKVWCDGSSGVCGKDRMRWASSVFLPTGWLELGGVREGRLIPSWTEGGVDPVLCDAHLQGQGLFCASFSNYTFNVNATLWYYPINIMLILWISKLMIREVNYPLKSHSCLSPGLAFNLPSEANEPMALNRVGNGKTQQYRSSDIPWS